MDVTERHVDAHLRHLGYTDIAYEPDGNVPPDFLLDKQIAIEVRRLNQNHEENGQLKGLEETAIPLGRRVEALLNSMGPSAAGESWFVFFRFSRPVEPWRSLKRRLRVGLDAFIASSTKTRSIIAKGQGFELEVWCKTPTPHANMFVIAGCTDSQSGGWVLAEMQRNIIHCASEKAHKVDKVRSKYPVWWLALVDHIGYGLSDFDQQLFRQHVSIEHDWDKIILIDPRDYTRWFEI